MDWSQPSLYRAIAASVASSLFASFAARVEYNTKSLTKAFGHPLDAMRVFGVIIVLMALWRDASFIEAILDQPTSPWLHNGTVFTSAIVLLVVGCVLFYTAVYRLGMRGCFYGDYFGLPLEKRIMSFPFDTLDHPMHVGSTMISLCIALLYGSWAGVLLSAITWCSYRVITAAEARHTTAIYGPYIPPVNGSVFKILALKTVMAPASLAPSSPKSPRY